AAGICIRDGLVLLSQRPVGRSMAGLWEFPGGKLHDGESPQAALCREFVEELAVTATPLEPYTFATHAGSSGSVLLLFYLCVIDGTPDPQENNPVRWVPIAELPTVEVPPADQDVVARLVRDHELGLL
ncbi:MAG: (deoxy)nucleoside triphosphate pyrophosphohydrolase, partial [Candidatus Dadabacteria bacterium]